MNKKRDGILFFLISIILFVVFRIFSYHDMKVFIPFSWKDLKIFLYIMFLLAMVWAIIEGIKRAIGDLMEDSWSERIIFIIVALLLIYLYKSTGRI